MTLHPAAVAVAEKADRCRPGWTDDAFDYVARFARQVSGDFLAEDVRTWAERQGLDRPHDARAYGTPIARAARERIIVKTGEMRCRRTSGHGNGYQPVWRKA